MKAHALDTVVLQRDLPERGLRRGDLGAVVEVYEPEGIEVEFVRASGRCLTSSSPRPSPPARAQTQRRFNVLQCDVHGLDIGLQAHLAQAFPVATRPRPSFDRLKDDGLNPHAGPVPRHRRTEIPWADAPPASVRS
jgi:hypothetical protein